MATSTRIFHVFRNCPLNSCLWRYTLLHHTSALNRWTFGCFLRHNCDSTRGFSSDLSKGDCNQSKAKNVHANHEYSVTDKTASLNQQPSESRILKVAIIGEANSGKSTLTNKLVGQKICAVTAIPHTTRRQTVGVFNVENSQIVLLDTPGLVSVSEARRLKLNRQHMLAPRAALEEADLIAIINDASDKRRSMRIHESILRELERHPDNPSVLILNKVDIVKQKSILLTMANVLLQDRRKDQWGFEDTGGWSKFEHVFMVSARTGDGVDDLKQYFAAKSKIGEWIYQPEVVTDQSVDEIIREVFREKLLEVYPHEIPWQTQQVSVLCEQRGDCWRIHHKLYCQRKSQRRCILDEIHRLRGLVVAELENVLSQPVDLSVEVGVSEKVGFQTPLHTY